MDGARAGQALRGWPLMAMDTVPVEYVAQALGVSVPDVLRASSSREWMERSDDGLVSRHVYVDPDGVEAGDPEWADVEFVITLDPGMTADDLVAKVGRAMGPDEPRRSRHPHPHPRRRKPLGDDLVSDAKALGIRVRTLARLEARGHSADDVRRALPRAMAARRHASRDEAIQAWYSSPSKKR